jgi:hypothetical protein
MQKSGGGSTRLKQHLAARGSSVLHCGRVPPPVQEYFQRDIERTKKATSERARQGVARLRLEDATPGCDDEGDIIEHLGQLSFYDEKNPVRELSYGPPWAHYLGGY